MQTIQKQQFEGERPLYRSQDLILQEVTILPGESGIKECRNIQAHQCHFQGMYVIWETPHVVVTDSHFAQTARASLWYDRDVTLRDTVIDAPKCLRRIDDVTLERVEINNAEETLWDCNGVTLRHVVVKGGQNIFLHTDNIYIDDYRQDGKYSFQYSHNVEIHNAVLNTKDAFWESENVTIYDSEINGEYLGWYAKNMRLVRCHISGTQGLCYVDGLTLEDCTFAPDADLMFEYSTVNGTINGNVTSIKNPTAGRLRIEGQLGQLIIDENQRKPGNFNLF